MSFSGSDSGSDAGRRKSGSSIPPPPLGRAKVGRYELIYPLAVGGMASVHVGRLSGMAGFEKLVAIKTIHPHLAVQPEFVKMFLDEARVAARIHHPNVGEILEIGEDDGLLFMVGELIRGQDLRQIFRRAGRSAVPISHGMIAFIGSQVCLALHAAHSLSDPDLGPLHIVHRDVSPRNVLVTYDGFVKLIDFGVASVRGKISQTESDGLKGKIGFMSPEQLRGHGVDRRSDVFSLGVMLYLMVTGTHPFPGDSDGARVERVLNGPIVPPREVNPRMRPEMEAIVLKAMARDRVERYRDAAELCRDLEEYVRRSGERVGGGALAELVSGLFADKIADHEIRIRSFRKNAADATGLQALASSGTAGLPAVLDGEGDTGPGTPSAMRRRADIAPAPASRTGRDRRLVLAGGGAVALVVGLIAVVVTLLTGGEQVDADPAVAVAAPAAETPGSGPVQVEADVGDPSGEAKPTAVTVSVRIDPPEAAVRLDGRAAALEGGALLLPADGSSHEIEVSLAGFRTERRQVIADRDRALDVSLQRLPSEEKPVMKEKGSTTGDKPPVATGDKPPAGVGDKPPAGAGDKATGAKPPKKKKTKDTGLMDSPYS